MAKEVVLTTTQRELATRATDAIALMSNAETAAAGITQAIRAVAEVEAILALDFAAKHTYQGRRPATDSQIAALVTYERMLVTGVNQRAMLAFGTDHDMVFDPQLPLPIMSETAVGRNLVMAFGEDMVVVPFGRILTDRDHDVFVAGNHGLSRRILPEPSARLREVATMSGQGLAHGFIPGYLQRPSAPRVAA